MCFSANTLPHFFGLIKFFFRSWLSEKWKMPLTPHSLGLHKLLGLFSPAVRPIINRSLLGAFVWIVLFFISPPNTREVKTASWFCFTGEAEKDCALLWILLTWGASKIISKKSDSFCFIMMTREAAEARVHKMCFGYLDSGGDDEVGSWISNWSSGWWHQLRNLFPFSGDSTAKQGRLQWTRDAFSRKCHAIKHLSSSERIYSAK